MDLRPLYQRSRALFLANAPHASRHRPGLRAARALPGVRVRCGSDAHAVSAAALAAGKPNAARDSLAFYGDEPSDIAVGESFSYSISESFGTPVRLSLAERFTSFTHCLALGISRAVRIVGARGDALTGRARSRAGA